MATKDEIREYRGCESVYVARVTEDSADGYSCDTPKYLAGVAEISRKIESTTETKYYDNAPAIQTSALGAPELTLNISALTNEKLAYITGLGYDTELDALDLGDQKPVDVALMYKYQLDNGDANYVIFYKGRFTVPEGSYKTRTTDAGEGEGCELTYNASQTVRVFTKTGKAGIGKEYLCPEDDITKAKADLSQFFDKVQDPDTMQKRETAGGGSGAQENNDGVE